MDRPWETSPSWGWWAPGRWAAASRRWPRRAGLQVVLVDSQLALAEKGRATIAGQLQKLVEKGKLTAPEQADLLARIHARRRAGRSGRGRLRDRGGVGRRPDQAALVRRPGRRLSPGRDPGQQHLVDQHHQPGRRHPPARSRDRHALHEPGADHEAGRDHPRAAHLGRDLRTPPARWRSGWARKPSCRATCPGSSSTGC